jgi:hypothetical protein
MSRRVRFRQWSERVGSRCRDGVGGGAEAAALKQNLGLEAADDLGLAVQQGFSQWPGQDSNLRATDYESAALTN